MWVNNISVINDIASRFVGLLPNLITWWTQALLKQVCLGGYRQPIYFAGPNGRGPWFLNNLDNRHLTDDTLNVGLLKRILLLQEFCWRSWNFSAFRTLFLASLYMNFKKSSRKYNFYRRKLLLWRKSVWLGRTWFTVFLISGISGRHKVTGTVAWWPQESNTAKM